MNGFDLLVLAILTSIGGVLLIAKGYRYAAGATWPFGWPPAQGETDHVRRETMRHAHMTAGARWLVISGLAFLLAVTRERDTIFLVEQWENVLMPCVVLTTAWVITSTRAARSSRKPHGTGGTLRTGGDAKPAQPAGADHSRLAALKRVFTIQRARAKAEPPSAGPTPGSLSHIMQCPDEHFWRNL